MTRPGPRVERGPPAGIIIVVASILAFLLWILVPLCASQAPTVGDKTSEEKTTGAATLGRSHQFDEDQNSKRRPGVHLTVRSFIKRVEDKTWSKQSRHSGQSVSGQVKWGKLSQSTLLFTFFTLFDADVLSWAVNLHSYEHQDEANEMLCAAE